MFRYFWMGMNVPSEDVSLQKTAGLQIPLYRGAVSVGPRMRIKVSGMTNEQNWPCLHLQRACAVCVIRTHLEAASRPRDASDRTCTMFVPSLISFEMPSLIEETFGTLIFLRAIEIGVSGAVGYVAFLGSQEPEDSFYSYLFSFFFSFLFLFFFFLPYRNFWGAFFLILPESFCAVCGYRIYLVIF